jgi:pimeloyl-ACP methyl ester carboxylesterase
VPRSRDQDAYETTNLKAKLARWHKDVDNAFYGWNGAWLDPNFRDWDISEYLAYIRVPVAILQGARTTVWHDAQIEIAQEECYCPVDVTMIPRAGHSPHREAPAATPGGGALEFAHAVLRRRRFAGAGGVHRAHGHEIKCMFLRLDWTIQKHALLCM